MRKVDLILPLLSGNVFPREQEVMYKLPLSLCAYCLPHHKLTLVGVGNLASKLAIVNKTVTAH